MHRYLEDLKTRVLKVINEKQLMLSQHEFMKVQEVVNYFGKDVICKKTVYNYIKKGRIKEYFLSENSDACSYIKLSEFLAYLKIEV